MVHPRKLIRDKVLTVLLNTTDCGANVFVNRVSDIWPEELPAINIVAISENADIYNVAPREYQRTLSLLIEVSVKAIDTIDDALDVISEQIEYLLNQDETLGGTVSDLIYSGTDMAINGDAEELIASARINYSVSFFSYGGADTTDLDMIDTHELTYDLNEGDTTPDTIDEINI